MRRISPRSHAGFVLAATLLPLCAFAAPLRLQLMRCESTVTQVPALNAKTLQARSAYGLKQAVALKQDDATLVTAKSPEGAEVLVAGKLEQKGAKYRLVYFLETRNEPKLHSQVAFEFATSKLSDRGVTAMAQDVVAEALKLEESRKAQAARKAEEELKAQAAPKVQEAPRQPVVASAPVSPPASPERASRAPEAVAPSDESWGDSYDSAYSVERKQPVAVIHLGFAGLYGPGMGTYGGGAVLEPKWNVTDSFSVGARVDAGALVGGSVSLQGGASTSTAAAWASLAKAEYLFGSSSVRPFLGLGAGLYLLAGESVSGSSSGGSVSQSGGQYFGVAPQAGIDFGLLRLSATYNHIVGGSALVQDISVGGEPKRIDQNYVNFELSFRIYRQSTPKPRALSVGY